VPQQPNDYAEQNLISAILEGTFAPAVPSHHDLPNQRTAIALLLFSLSLLFLWLRWKRLSSRQYTLQ
jgi:hypothetical protein